MKTLTSRDPRTPGPDTDQPAVQVSDVLELIGKDEQVDQDEYSGSAEIEVGIDTGLPVSGETVSLTLITLETGDDGVVLTPSGVLLLFDTDPNPTPGDAALTAAEWKTVIGSVSIVSSDWVSDAGGAHFFDPVAIPFHDVDSIFAVFLLTDATSFNDAESNDEELHIRLWYFRHS